MNRRVKAILALALLAAMSVVPALAFAWASRSLVVAALLAPSALAGALFIRWFIRWRFPGADGAASQPHRAMRLGWVPLVGVVIGMFILPVADRVAANAGVAILANASAFLAGALFGAMPPPWVMLARLRAMDS